MRQVRSTVLLLAVLLTVLVPLARSQEEDLWSEPEPRPYVPVPAWKSVEVGDFYFKKKNYRAALSRYKEAAQVDAYYAPAYLGLGKVYEKIGLKQKALDNYQKYLDMLPSTKQAEEAKDVHKAIARLERKLKKSSRRESSSTTASSSPSPR